MSSFVMSGVRSLAGKITRSGLETRTSRPPASTITASEEEGTEEVWPRRPPDHRPRSDRHRPSGHDVGYEVLAAVDERERHREGVRAEHHAHHAPGRPEEQ